LAIGCFANALPRKDGANDRIQAQLVLVSGIVCSFSRPLRGRHTHCAHSGEVDFLVFRTWQFCELCLGLPLDWDIWIGVLTQIQESLVGLPCGGFIAHHLRHAAELEPSKGSNDMSHAKTGIVNQLLELSGGRLASGDGGRGATFHFTLFTSRE
jgi:hypothetical protein